MSKKHKKNRGSLSAPAPAAEVAPAEETLIGVDDLGGVETSKSESEQPASEFSPDNAVNDAAPADADPILEGEKTPEVPAEELPCAPTHSW